jgi:DNA-binding GntR family transcriptional regulator
MSEMETASGSFRVKRVAAPLRQSVTESIRNAIAVGHFRPGERLPERELCEMTGVSRTLVREALRQLESEGVIKVIAHRGPVVTQLTAAQAEGVYAVRAELEGLACELFARNASQAQEAELEGAFAALKKAMGKGDPIERLEAKNAFYECLMRGSGNEALGDTLRMLNSRVTLLRATSLQAAGRSAKSIAELEDVLAALRARDGKKARAAAERHVRNATHAALAQMTDRTA